MPIDTTSMGTNEDAAIAVRPAVLLSATGLLQGFVLAPGRLLLIGP